MKSSDYKVENLYFSLSLGVIFLFIGWWYIKHTRKNIEKHRQPYEDGVTSYGVRNYGQAFLLFCTGLYLFADALYRIYKTL